MASRSDHPLETETALVPLEGKCGAHSRSSGKPCRNPAGFKTDHPGEGRCFLHGGRTPVKHGRYSKIRPVALRRMIEIHEADPDPLNLLPELATARALLEDQIAKGKKAGGELNHGILIGHLEVISRIVKRIEDIRSQDAISRPELIRVMTEMGRNAEHRMTQFGRRVEEIVPREKAGQLEDLLNQMREELLDDWNRIRVA